MLHVLVHNQFIYYDFVHSRRSTPDRHFQFGRTGMACIDCILYSRLRTVGGTCREIIRMMIGEAEKYQCAPCIFTQKLTCAIRVLFSRFSFLLCAVENDLQIAISYSWLRLLFASPQLQCGHVMHTEYSAKVRLARCTAYHRL